MLQLKQITKEYELGKKNSKNYQIVKALKGVDLSFRNNEFVSILGPSGCGKTTMLNIVGGLDKYTSGDLVIRGKSTKEFNDKDWDNYRNHSVGFVFQSYNLIHHQSILHNVELALTLSGVSKKERKARALEALAKVGLKDRANVKPNQLSGGQMQRVAIARAIVNDPDIILADEPTGALDSKTSVQIMEILKVLSKTRLVIMVTHIPELAQAYSSRIVRFKDGEVVDDTNPYTHQETEQPNNEQHNEEFKDNPQTNVEQNQALQEDVKNSKVVVKKPKKRMSFWTALTLSFKNLLTKKARTILVAFAGSIGIIGIALILAVSSGFSGYINKVQEDTLSSYPIVIEEQSVNYMNIMTSMFSGTDKPNHGNDGVYPNDTLSSILDSFANGMETNDMKSFNTYLQANYDKIGPYVNAIKYTYDLDLHIYKNNDTSFADPLSPSNSALYDLIVNYSVVYLLDSTKLERDTTYTDGLKINYIEDVSDLTFFETYKAYSTDILNIYNGLKNDGTYIVNEKEIVSIITILFRMDISAYKTMDIGVFNEMIDNEKFIKSQYQLLHGDWSNSEKYEIAGKPYFDTMLVLNEDNELDDYLLYALGFIDKSEMDNLFNAMLKDETYPIKINYEDVVGSEFKLYLKSDTYYNDGSKYVQTEDKIPSDENKDNYITMRISGIIKVNEETNGGALDEGIVYPKSLTDYCIERYNASAPVVAENLSYIDKSSPKTIAIYANSFEMKEIIEDFIIEYNAGVGEDQKITYTDYMSLMMDTVSSIVDIVSYVLIAFVSVSLIVSSIMIGIITYISVLERTKEIGVLRSVGASKKDIKRVFTAESLIIGFASGALGIAISLLLCIPINLILKTFTGISTIASLPVGGAIALILISMALTFIAGLIPAQVASKKDPVIALRSE